MLRDHSRKMPRELYVVLGLEPRPAECRASDCPHCIIADSGLATVVKVEGKLKGMACFSIHTPQSALKYARGSYRADLSTGNQAPFPAPHRA